MLFHAEGVNGGGMSARMLVFAILPLFMLPAFGCKQQYASQNVTSYIYLNSAFSHQPGEAWSGDTQAMLRDMQGVIQKGNYGTMFASRKVAGFFGRFSQSVVLRPLSIPGKQNETVYALESTACGPAMEATPYEPIRELFKRKYTTYTVVRQQ